MHYCFQVQENVISVHIKSHALPRVSRKLQKVINVQKNLIYFLLALLLAFNMQKSRKRFALWGYNQEILIVIVIPVGLYSVSL